MTIVDVSAMTIESAIEEGIQAAKASNRTMARLQFEQVTELVPDCADGWLWLAWTCDSPSQTVDCLQRAHQLAPENDLIVRYLEVATLLDEYVVPPQATPPSQTDRTTKKAAESSPDLVSETDADCSRTAPESTTDPRTGRSSDSGTDDEVSDHLRAAAAFAFIANKAATIASEPVKPADEPTVDASPVTDHPYSPELLDQDVEAEINALTANIEQIKREIRAETGQSR